MLETISAWTARRFAPGSRPTNATVVRWITAGEIYGRQIGGKWYVDESVRLISTGPTPQAPIDTGNEVADRILRSINGGR